MSFLLLHNNTSTHTLAPQARCLKNQNEQTTALALQRGERRASGHSSSETHFPYIEFGTEFVLARWLVVLKKQNLWVANWKRDISAVKTGFQDDTKPKPTMAIKIWSLNEGIIREGVGSV